jgi:hypothetical protein
MFLKHLFAAALTRHFDFLLEIPLAHCVRGGMVCAAGRTSALARRRFRSLTAFACGMVRAARRERGKKKGGGRKSSVTRKPASAALLFPFLTPCAMHHSAKRDSVERNLQRTPFF